MVDVTLHLQADSLLSRKFFSSVGFETIGDPTWEEYDPLPMPLKGLVDMQIWRELPRTKEGTVDAKDLPHLFFLPSNSLRKPRYTSTLEVDMIMSGDDGSISYLSCEACTTFQTGIEVDPYNHGTRLLHNTLGIYHLPQETLILGFLAIYHNIVQHNKNILFLSPVMSDKDMLLFMKEHSDLRKHIYGLHNEDGHWFLFHLKQYRLEIYDCEYNKQYNYTKMLKDVKDDITLAQNPKNKRIQTIKVFPMKEAIQMSQQGDDQQHCGVNVFLNLLESLMNENFVVESKKEEVQSFLNSMKQANRTLRQRYFMCKILDWSSETFTEPERRTAAICLAKTLYKGIHEKSLTYYGTILQPRLPEEYTGDRTSEDRAEDNWKVAPTEITDSPAANPEDNWKVAPTVLTDYL